MDSPTYQFNEMPDIDLEELIAFKGWLGAKNLKIYTDETFEYFYLYDELRGNLLRFRADRTVLKEDSGYEQLCDAYQSWLAQSH